MGAVESPSSRLSCSFCRRASGSPDSWESSSAISETCWILPMSSKLSLMKLSGMVEISEFVNFSTSRGS